MRKQKGLVYVLTNPAMPGIVKIGITKREKLDGRLREHFKTNVPVPFKCEYACQVDDCNKVEKALQRAFKPHRFPKREFFKIEPDQAIAILQLFGKKVITAEINKEIDENTTFEERNAAEKLEKQRRPPLNFKEMGIQIGSKLQFTENDIKVEVVEDRKVKYRNKLYSLTGITKELLQIDYAMQPTGYWLYKGKSLKDIYNETYATE